MREYCIQLEIHFKLRLQIPVRKQTNHNQQFVNYFEICLQILL